MASDEYTGGYKILLEKGLVGRKGRGIDTMETELALGLLYSVGLVIDFDTRVLHRAVRKADFGLSQRPFLGARHNMAEPAPR